MHLPYKSYVDEIFLFMVIYIADIFNAFDLP